MSVSFLFQVSSFKNRTEMVLCWDLCFLRMKFLRTFEDKLITIWVQIRDLFLYVFRHAIIVNGYVDDRTWRGIRHRNWGDDLNYYFLQELTGRPVVMYHNFKLANLLCMKNYLCIGTMIDAKNVVNSKSIIWGSGVSGLERSFVHPDHIISVRGPRTKDFCNRYGVKCPDVYGDPALLLSLLYQPRRWKLTPHYRIGLIPNIADTEHPVVADLLRNATAYIKVIDMSSYNCWKDIIDTICSCDFILSSSLHGLIVSDVYQIPNIWIRLTGKAIVGHLKFLDYCDSVERNIVKPVRIEKTSDITDLLDNADSYFSCADPEKVKELQDGLIAVAPFKLKIPRRSSLGPLGHFRSIPEKEPSNSIV